MVILKIWKPLQELFLNNFLSLNEELCKSEPSFSSQLCFKGLLIYDSVQKLVEKWRCDLCWKKNTVLFPIDGLIL